ncbi:MAG TPA: hypothetical protein PLR60_00205 [Syntrophorhabdaceae bacterium]|nr:hypothetical protein [Syntrophorhabdaceae bacterium]
MMSDPDRARELRVVMKRADAGVFMPLLQEGFIVRCKTGITIEDLLREDFGIARDYMEKRLSTVFLDGQCIDDIDSAIVHGGAVLALSSAMPGLVGATLRRKGILASMRASITHRGQTGQAVSAGEGFVTIKLFNVLAGELGPVFLARGIYVKAAGMKDFLQKRGGPFWSAISRTIFDGRQIDREKLPDALGDEAGALIMLRLAAP